MNILDTPLNPINIYVCSSNSTSTTNNHYYFELNESIITYNNVDILIGLENFQFVNSIYNINSNNCYLHYQIFGSAVSYMYITHGNYNITTLLKYLNNSPFFTFSYNPITYKITIENKNGDTFTLLGTRPNSILPVLGFYNDIDTSYMEIQDSPNIFNLATTRVLHICLDNILVKSIGVKDDGKHNILASIPVNGGFGTCQSYSLSKFKYKLDELVINGLSICIYDQDFNMVDFNGIDWHMNITFEFMYKKDLITPISLLQFQQQQDNQQINDSDGLTAKDYLMLEEERNIINDIIK